MGVIDHKCVACGASLPFNPKTQRWDCEYCGASYSLVELNEKEEELKKKRQSYELDSYHCPDCGAQIVADETTSATFCVYCGNTSIIKERIKGEFNPSKIIPFQTTKEQAIEAFKKMKKGKIYAPKEFNSEENIQKITGVYIPFWVYDCISNGNVEFDCKNFSSWTSGNYTYTKTDFYDVRRSGKMQFDNVPVDGSSKFDDDMMDSIEPFLYDGLKAFDISYLSGFLSERYDVTKENASTRMKKRVENTTIDELKQTVKGYANTSLKNANVELDIKEIEYMLLPVWMLNIKYKDKLYLFAMNGQTGKMVGNVPIVGAKVALTVISLFIVLFIIFSILDIFFI
ncbi:MAG: zinc ribbon domain-containing protein [Clostridia bacterium]|nr:zinc ribbon domain-containing protein [Clostridia bacterium]